MPEMKSLTLNDKTYDCFVDSVARNMATWSALTESVAGESVGMSDASNHGLTCLRIFGKTTQDGTPTPDAPVPLASVGDSGSITVNVAGENEAKSMTILTPTGLPGVPVTSGGNYTDANGQQRICDEIDFGRGVHIQRVNFITTENLRNAIFTLNNSEGSAEFNQYIVHGAINMNAPGSVSTIDPLKAYCNIFPLGRQIYHITDEESFWIYAGESLALVLNKNTCPDAESAKEYILGRDMIIYYPLATPIETPLSEEELAAYAALHTYKDSTTISNDASAYMELEYVMDVKKHIDSMITAGILEATVE